ncbi:MAG: indolepyruvate ferredoxin oxidoreductase subunit alpha, partial [Planctomycetota bacterium]
RTVRIDPEIVQEECRRCGLCERSCPAQAIGEGDEGFEIDLAKCIRCFCCHELCPHGAVVLRRSLPVRIYDWLHGRGDQGKEDATQVS